MTFDVPNQHKNRLDFDFTDNFCRTTFVEVFATLFWIVFVFVTFCFLLFGLFSFKFVHDEVPVGNKSISGIVFLSLLAKEIWISPKRLPGKIFILTLGLTGAIISYSYNAGLVSLLSVEIFWYPIKSIEVNKNSGHDELFYL